jgi:hypothetical protein
LLSISSGIDGCLWAVQYTPLAAGENATTKDYPLLKWQTLENKWYRIDNITASAISAYNEISAAIVNKVG